MSKRIIGLVVACVLALFGASLVDPAAASPPASTSAKVHAAKVKASKVKAARMHAAKVKAVKARVAKAKSAVPAKPPLSKAAKAAKAKAAAQAKAVAKARAKAVAAARARAVAAAKAKALAAARAQAAARARVNYAAQAWPRAVAAAKVASAARARATAAATALAQARVKASAAATAASMAQTRATALAKTTAKSKVKKKAVKAAKATALTSAKANARVVTRTAALARARATVTVAAATAARARKAAGPNPLWAPKDSLIFNNPRGTKQQKLAIITQLDAAIDATPAGGQIRMAMYLFDIKSVATKLNAATRRGVSVQILIDDGETNRYIREVRKAAGTNKLARSFVATCSHSCMSNGTSVIHAKFYLFSVAGKARYVSMISSANPYTGNTYSSWNNSHTIVGDEKIYDSLSTYFTDMLADKNNLNYYRVTTSGKYTIYLYPEVVRRPEDIVLLNVLNHTACRTTAKGYGSDGRTLIRVANWGWTGARLDIAKRLWALHNAGCKVQVMINKGRITRNVLKVLLKPSKTYGKMPVFNAWYDRNNNDFAELYVHHKMVTINGLLGGKNVKATWTGSQNFTLPATLANNDIILRVVDPAVTDAYNRNFAYIRHNYTRRMYSVPWITRQRVGD